MAVTTTESRRDAGAPPDVLDLVRRMEARQKALAQVTMHMLATLAATASREDVERLLAELERIRDLTGPAGIAAGEIVATAIATLERASRR